MSLIKLNLQQGCSSLNPRGIEAYYKKQTNLLSQKKATQK